MPYQNVGAVFIMNISCFNVQYFSGLTKKVVNNVRGLLWFPSFFKEGMLHSKRSSNCKGGGSLPVPTQQFTPG